MKLEILYVEKYEYTVESYGNDSERTGCGELKAVEWDGMADVKELIQVHAQQFLAQAHSSGSRFSFDHKNHRIEVTGLRIGGEHGLIFKSVTTVVIKAAVGEKCE